MAFHDVSFPMTLALGATGGPQWRAEIVELASGAMVRNTAWSRGRRRWEVSSALTDLASLQTLIGFFEARSGPVHGFRFRDPVDHCSGVPGQSIDFADEILGHGDGETVQFQIVKSSSGFTRAIHKPVSDSVLVGVGGLRMETGWTVDPLTGQITFETPPPLDAEITAGFLYDIAVRFESDQMSAVVEAFGAGRVATITLVEIWEPVT